MFKFAIFALFFVLATSYAAPAVTFEKFQQLTGWTNHTLNTDSIDLSDGTNVLRFYPGRRRTELNERVVWLNDVIEPAGQELIKLNARDAREVLIPLLQTPAKKAQPLRIMLDPGHGGEDSGAVSVRPSLYEKDVVLDLALKIGQRLQEAGMSVGYTRTNDTFLSLSHRTVTAKVWRADAFVSIHANSAANRYASGPETFVIPFAGCATTCSNSRLSSRSRTGNRNDRYNNLLGFSIQRHLPAPCGAADRGLRRARFQVLRQAFCPAALVEVGFLSHFTEARLLESGWFRSQIAHAIADGILEYSQRLPAKPALANHKVDIPVAKDNVLTLSHPELASEAMDVPEKSNALSVIKP